MAKKKTKVDAKAARAEVVQAFRSQSPTDRERRMVLQWASWQEARAYLKKIRADMKIEIERAESFFTDAISTGVAIGDEDAALRKLHAVEVCYQDLEEAQAKAKDAIAGARDGVGATEAAFAESMEAQSQLDLEFNRGLDAVDDLDI